MDRMEAGITRGAMSINRLKKTRDYSAQQATGHVILNLEHNLLMEAMTKLSGQTAPLLTSTPLHLNARSISSDVSLDRLAWRMN